MREAQRANEEHPTDKKRKAAAAAELAVDKWLERNVAELAQLGMWERSVKSSEVAGVYNVRDEEKAAANGNAERPIKSRRSAKSI